MRNGFILFSLLAIAAIIGLSFLWPSAWYLFILVGPILLLGLYDMVQTQNTVWRNFPVLGHGRSIAEVLRPKLYQYFIESDIDGTPVNKMFRDVVYNRASKKNDTTPFGTKNNVYATGYEWLNHSLYPADAHQLDQHPRVTIGNDQCKQPYECSLLNISAMSYGSLSSVAVEALNHGARIGGFAHNTGEGGISPYHLKPGGDLIWQIGTGYFGCRNEKGQFNPDLFAKNAAHPQVKMIEVKLSQGAKPGHGGILPGEKVTAEIAGIRNVKEGETVHSPAYHTAFSTPQGLMQFIAQLRKLSNGKPIGFKLCVGQPAEFLALCLSMIETDIYPDFIAVDGGEGGTGAAPLEFTNSLGMPFREGLAFAHDALVGMNIRHKVKLLASGKIFTGFHMARALALGADACYSARGMMLALGCIQALECNHNSCPTGITTHKPHLKKGLVVSDKKEKVAQFHGQTMKAFTELIAACGLTDPAQLERKHIYRRVEQNEIRRYDEIYPPMQSGHLRQESTPEGFDAYLAEAHRLAHKE